jgi:hypothetical protein
MTIKPGQTVTWKRSNDPEDYYVVHVIMVTEDEKTAIIRIPGLSQSFLNRYRNADKRTVSTSSLSPMKKEKDND